MMMQTSLETRKEVEEKPPPVWDMMVMRFCVLLGARWAWGVFVRDSRASCVSNSEERERLSLKMR
jgi:hypothetical protein